MSFSFRCPFCGNPLGEGNTDSRNSYDKGTPGTDKSSTIMLEGELTGEEEIVEELDQVLESGSTQSCYGSNKNTEKADVDRPLNLVLLC